MNIVSLANVGLAGFLVSLLVLECLRPLLCPWWPVQSEGLQVERRLMPWLLALLAGPALLWDRSEPYRAGRVGSRADMILLLVLLALWSASYGASLAFVVRLLFQIAP